MFWQSPEPKDQTLKMIKILSGEMAIELHLQFLIRNNNTDLMILKSTKVGNATVMEPFKKYLLNITNYIYFLLNTLLHFIPDYGNTFLYKNNNGRNS